MNDGQPILVVEADRRLGEALASQLAADGWLRRPQGDGFIKELGRPRGEA